MNERLCTLVMALGYFPEKEPHLFRDRFENNMWKISGVRGSSPLPGGGYISLPIAGDVLTPEEALEAAEAWYQQELKAFSKRPRNHEVVYIAGGLFKTACGIYLDGPDKERGVVFPEQVTCKNCQRAHG